jgi:hypothetical protein
MITVVHSQSPTTLTRAQIKPNVVLPIWSFYISEQTYSDVIDMHNIKMNTCSKAVHHVNSLPAWFKQVLTLFRKKKKKRKEKMLKCKCEVSTLCTCRRSRMNHSAGKAKEDAFQGAESAASCAQTSGGQSRGYSTSWCRLPTHQHNKINQNRIITHIQVSTTERSRS